MGNLLILPILLHYGKLLFCCISNFHNVKQFSEIHCTHILCIIYCISFYVSFGIKLPIIKIVEQRMFGKAFKLILIEFSVIRLQVHLWSANWRKERSSIFKKFSQNIQKIQPEKIMKIKPWKILKITIWNKNKCLLIGSLKSN